MTFPPSLLILLMKLKALNRAGIADNETVVGWVAGPRFSSEASFLAATVSSKSLSTKDETQNQFII